MQKDYTEIFIVKFLIACNTHLCIHLHKLTKLVKIFFELHKHSRSRNRKDHRWIDLKIFFIFVVTSEFLEKHNTSERGFQVEMQAQKLSHYHTYYFSNEIWNLKQGWKVNILEKFIHSKTIAKTLIKVSKCALLKLCTSQWIIWENDEFEFLMSLCCYIAHRC